MTAPRTSSAVDFETSSFRIVIRCKHHLRTPTAPTNCHFFIYLPAKENHLFSYFHCRFSASASASASAQKPFQMRAPPSTGTVAPFSMFPKPQYDHACSGSLSHFVFLEGIYFPKYLVYKAKRRDVSRFLTVLGRRHATLSTRLRHYSSASPSATKLP